MPTLPLTERCSETKVEESRRDHSAERTWITGASVASEYSFIFPLHLKYSAWCINNKTMLLNYFKFADLHIFHDFPLKRNLKNISKSHENNCILSNLLIFFRLYNFVINSLLWFDFTSYLLNYLYLSSSIKVNKIYILTCTNLYLYKHGLCQWFSY